MKTVFFVTAALGWLVGPGNGMLEWKEIQERAARAESEYGLVEVTIGLPSGRNRLELDFAFREEYISVALALEDQLFHPYFAHHIVGHNSSLAVDEDLRCLYSDHGAGSFASICGTRFSAYVETGSGKQLHLELARASGAVAALRKAGSGVYTVQALVYTYRPAMDPEWSCGNEDSHKSHSLQPAGQAGSMIKEERPSTIIGKSDKRLRHVEEPERPVSGRELDAFQKVKYIKLVIVNDNERFKVLGDDTFAMSADLIQRVQLLIAAFNRKSHADSGYRLEIQIVRMMSFQHSDPWTLETNKAGEVSHSDLLSEFTGWRQQMLEAGNLDVHGAAHLLSGHNFAGSVVGFAYVDELCSEGYASAVVQTRDLSHQVAATTLAHELMHNIGVPHTNRDRGANSLVPEPCNGGGYIMDPSGTNSDEWSECTVNHVKMAFGEQAYPLGCAINGACDYFPKYGPQPHFHNGACAETRAKTEWTLEPECGNGVVEDGEECDCPGADCSANPCCNGQTCRLVDQAQCNADDPCCDPSSCKPVPKSANLVCRSKGSESCGVEETCNGVDSKCPIDLHEPTGTTCGEGGENGACYGGVCQSHEEQCKRHLGSNFVACPNKDHNDGGACGDLWCLKIGAPRSQCRKVINQADGQTPYKVENGTPCGAESDQKVCYDSKCLEPAQVKLPVTIACFNGRQDTGETDVDCGGSSCHACLPNERCILDSDCASAPNEPGRCSFNGTLPTLPTAAPTFGTDIPAGGCTQSDKDKCIAFSGCTWLDEFGVCRRSGHFPRASGCSVENVDESWENCCDKPLTKDKCINWSMCRWQDDKCVLGPTNSPTPWPSPSESDSFGICYDYSAAKPDDVGDDDGDAMDFWEKVWLKIQDNMIVVVSAGGGAVLLGICLALCVCYRSCRTPKESPNKHSAHRHRTRQSLPSDHAAIQRATAVHALRSAPSSHQENSSSFTSLQRPLRPQSSMRGSSSADLLENAPSTAAAAAAATAAGASYPRAPTANSCPRCTEHFSNPQNPGRLCNACNYKVSREGQSAQVPARPPRPARPAVDAAAAPSSVSQYCEGSTDVDTTSASSHVTASAPRERPAHSRRNSFGRAPALAVASPSAPIMARTEPAEAAPPGAIVAQAVVLEEPVVYAVGSEPALAAPAITLPPVSSPSHLGSRSPML